MKKPAMNFMLMFVLLNIAQLVTISHMDGLSSDFSNMMLEVITGNGSYSPSYEIVDMEENAWIMVNVSVPEDYTLNVLATAEEEIFESEQDPSVIEISYVEGLEEDFSNLVIQLVAADGTATTVGYSVVALSEGQWVIVGLERAPSEDEFISIFARIDELETEESEEPEPEEPEEEPATEDETYNESEDVVLDSKLDVFDAAGKKILKKISKGKEKIKVTFHDAPIKKIVFHDLTIDPNFSASLGLDDVPEDIPTPAEGMEWEEVYAIDPSSLNFSTATVTVVAKANALYKCKNWDFSSRECTDNGWELLRKDLVPGNNYTITITPDDPAFGEANISIINVYSTPVVGSNWTVYFNTTGVALLAVQGVNGTVWDDIDETGDLRFLELRCGNTTLDPIWNDFQKVVVQPGYDCNDTGSLISKVLTSGLHTLEFLYGVDVEYAYNDASQNVSSCDEIITNGSYRLTTDLSGAPFNASEVGVAWACIKIASSNVTFDCNGYSITNNGTSNAAGIVINGSDSADYYKNITIKNCPSISGYESGIYIFKSSEDVVQNTTAHSNTYGFTLYSSSANLTDDAAHNNTGGGLSLYDSSTTATDFVFYNNSVDLGLVNPPASGSDRLNLTRGLFLNPAGTYYNYTNLSINDSIQTSQGYGITWTTNSSTIPVGMSPFSQFVNITNFTSGGSIDSIAWSWAGHPMGAFDNESRFELWKWNASGWYTLNDTPDTAADRLSLANLNPASDYGILQRGDGCRLITSPGGYQLDGNAFGAPFNSSETGIDWACIKIASSNVTFDCNGYNITNTGSAEERVGIVVNGSDSVDYTNVTIKNCPRVSGYEAGVYIFKSAQDVVQNVTARDNVFAGGAYGFVLYGSSSINLTNDIAHNNSLVGFYLYQSSATMRDCTFYNNTADLGLVNLVTFKMYNGLFLNPSGTLQNYTNLSLNDTISASEGYGITWTANSTALPNETRSFRQKFLNITNATPSVSISSMVWHWTGSEATGYNESKLQLWKWDGSSWADTYATLDATANTLTLTNHDPASDYGILESNITENCPIISASGAYQMNSSFTGAPNAIGGYGSVCIYINTSDVLFDCSGYNITNDGTGNAHGILVKNDSSGELTNVTIKNCQEISSYQHGVRFSYVNNSLIDNVTAYNSTDHAFYLSSSSYNTLTNNTAYNNSDKGFNFESGSNHNNLTNNTARRNGAHGFELENSSYNTLTDNSAYDNLDIGFKVELSVGNNLSENMAYNNSLVAFMVDASNYTTLSDNTAYNETYDFVIFSSNNNTMTNNTARDGDYGFILFQVSDYNNLTDNKAYNHTNHGFYINDSSYNTLTNSTAYNNSGSGFYINDSSYNTLTNSTAYNNIWYGVYVIYSDNNNLTNNTAYDNGIHGFTIHINSNDNNLTNNTAYLNSKAGFLVSVATDNNLTNNTAHSNGDRGFGIYINATNNTLTDNTAYNNSNNGFDVYSSAHYTTLTDNTAYNNSGSGFYVASDNNTLTDNTAYENTYDLYVDGTDVALTYSMTNTLFLNPSGTLQNYTNLSITDTVAMGEKYTINWTTNSAALPTYRFSFAQKFVDISNQSVNVSIDSITWTWLDSELNDTIEYNESKFELWKYNGTWAMLNDTPDTSANTLSLTNHDPSSDYGILESNITKNCPVITSPGTYIQGANYTGAPNDASEVSNIDWACVKIASSNVVFDCNGSTITNNGTSAAAGIVINGSASVNYTNVTIRNCPSVSGYREGVYIHNSSDDAVQNVTTHNNTNDGIYLYYSSDSNLTDNTVYNNTNNGFFLYGSSNNIINDSTTYYNGYGFRLLSNSEYNTIGNSTAYNNSRGFFVTAGSDFNNFTNNTAYNSTSDGFTIDSSSNNTLVRNTIYLSNTNGFDLDAADDNTLINNTAYSNNHGFSLWSSSYNTFTNNTAHSNTQSGFYVGSNSNYTNLIDNKAYNNSNGIYIVSNYNNLTSNKAYNSSAHGLRLHTSSNSTLTNNTACNNSVYGLFFYRSGNVSASNTHTYNNSQAAIYLYTLNTPRTVYFTNLTIDSPLGNFTNYTSLVINDTIEANASYMIRWTTNSTGLPSDRFSFAQKFVDISNQSVNVSIDSITWTWLDSELNDTIEYDESKFELWKHNGTWAMLNDTPDTSANTLSLTNHDPASDYGILESNITVNCPIISASGTYQMNGSFTGAPNAIGGYGDVCVYINASDVLFDCNGYNITNDGTGNAHGILVKNDSSGELTNVTIKNCQEISSYQHGVRFSYVNNSLIDNVTAYNSTDHAFYLSSSSYNTLTNNTAYNNSDKGFNFESGSNHNNLTNNTARRNGGQGFELENSSYNTLTDSSAYDNLDIGFKLELSVGNNLSENMAYNNSPIAFMVESSNYSTLSDNTAYNETYNFIVFSSNNNTLTNNTARDGGYGLIIFQDSDNNNLTDNKAYNNTMSGFYLNDSSYGILTNNTVYDNQDGFVVAFSSNNTLFNNTAYQNSRYGLHMNTSNDTNVTKAHLYDNTQQDVYITSVGSTSTVYLTDLLIDNPSGNLENYTNLSLSDTVGTNTSYSINWTTNSSVLPANYTSFRQKFVNISNSTSGVSIDSIVWHWTDNESAGYTESNFRLWKYNATNNWTNTNATLNTTANTLGLTNHDPASIYGILRPEESECMIISSPGSYQLRNNVTGAPHVISSFSICIAIQASNVTFDCDGYSVTNNGTTGLTAGIVAIGNYQNVTIKNCPSVSGYQYGVGLDSADNSFVRNVTAHDNGDAGIYIARSGNHNLVTNCTSYGHHSGQHASDGFYMHSGLNNTFTDNIAYDNDYGFDIRSGASTTNMTNNTAYNNTTQGFYIISNSNVNRLVDNTAFNCTYGFTIDTSGNDVLRNNTAYNNTYYGFHVLSSDYNVLTGNEAYENSERGFFLDVGSDYNTLENNSAYSNSAHAFEMDGGSNHNNLTNNSAYDNGDIGFKVESSLNNNLVDNTAYNNTPVAFMVEASNYTTLSDNTAYDQAYNFIVYSSNNNTLTNNTARDGDYGFIVFQVSDYNNLTGNKAYNHTLYGFYLNDTSHNDLTSNNATSNGQDGMAIDNSNDTLIDPSYFCNNTGNGITVNNSNNTIVDDSVSCNNTAYGIEITNSNNTTVNRSSIYSNSYGIFMTNATTNTFTDNNVTNNTNNGIRFDSGTSSSNLTSNYVCFNSLDINNQGTSNNGTLDSCDAFAGWYENGHLGCEYTCSSFWHRFFGDVNGTKVLTDASSSGYIYTWNASGFSVYFTDYDASINWNQLQAIGRNTSNQTSSNDFEELDVAFNGTNFSDNINTTYSTDGSLPKATDNYTVFMRPIDYVPVANSTEANTTFETGILWDMGDGGTEYSNNQSTVWVVKVNTSASDAYGTYDYLIQVPYTLAAYEGGTDLVSIYLELE